LSKEFYGTNADNYSTPGNKTIPAVPISKAGVHALACFFNYWTTAWTTDHLTTRYLTTR
jgi:hypothetical protein